MDVTEESLVGAGIAADLSSVLVFVVTRLYSRVGSHAAVLKSVRLIPRLHEIAAVSQAIKKCRRHLGVTEHL